MIAQGENDIFQEYLNIVFINTFFLFMKRLIIIERRVKQCFVMHECAILISRNRHVTFIS